MRMKAACGAVGLLLAVPALAAGDEPVIKVGGLIDLRYAHTDTERSWLDRGPGKLRYGASVAGRADLLRLGQLSLLVDAEPSLVLSAHVQLNVDAEPDEAGLRSRADLIQAFLQYRPELSPSVRLRFRGGAFFPPISLEHTGPAWTTPYTITPSAANSWIGEEVRTVGAEGTLELKRGQDEVRLTGAGYGSNDPAGTLLGWRGWALHDRQTGFGDRLAYAPVPAMSAGAPFARNARWAEPMVEVDGRIGWYAGATVRRAGRFEARALRFDNRGDPTVFDGGQYAWWTRFSAFALRVELPGTIHLLGQHMQGQTNMGPTPGGVAAVAVPFRTTYVLLSIPVRRHRLAARYERFRTEDEDVLRELDPNAEDGRAWTACYAFEPTPRQRIALEVVRIEADRAVRPLLGHPVRSEETLVQASWRLSF